MHPGQNWVVVYSGQDKQSGKGIYFTDVFVEQVVKTLLNTIIFKSYKYFLSFTYLNLPKDNYIYVNMDDLDQGE